MATRTRVGRDPATALSDTTADLIGREKAFGARNYDPLPVVLARGEGSWLTDVDGRRYLDLMSAYSAVSFGHGHPRIVGALDRAGAAAGRHVARLPQQRAAVPVRAPGPVDRSRSRRSRPTAGPKRSRPRSRRRANGVTRSRGLPKGAPRSSAVTAISTAARLPRPACRPKPQYRDGFGPFPPGLSTIPYGDADALARAITPRTAAFLVEPIQGESGIVVPPPGYLVRCAQICREHHVLLICDEIQTGFGRTGKFLACEHDGVKPDGVILGKALGGGLLPVSAFVATNDVMQVFRPGDHGSTFGGNPLAAAVAMAALDVLYDEKLIERVGATGRVAAVRAAGPAKPRRPRCPRPWVVHRHRSGRALRDGATGRRPAPGARHPVEGYARHRGAHRAAAQYPARRPRLGGRARSARSSARSSAT